jgi:imidazolonepropionase-like amidohydrolase
LSDTPQRLIFRNANLLDGDNPARPRQTLVVDGTTISSIGDAPIEAAPGDRVLDLGGKTLMPGLVTTHFHSTYNDITIMPQPLGLEKPPGYLTLVAEKNLQLALESGFTSVVSAAASR